jgi:hypothetical protein
MKISDGVDAAAELDAAPYPYILYVSLFDSCIGSHNTERLNTLAVSL